MLKRVSIQNFKSLKDVTLDLQPINLLIGPNNSGKTNFLKAFEYMEHFVEQETTNLSDDVFFNKKPSLDLKLRFIFDNDFSLDDKDSYKHFIFTNSNQENGYNPRIGKIKSGYSENISSSITFHEEESIIGISYDYSIGFTVIYNIDPTIIKYAYPLLPNNSIIMGDGSNIVPFLDTLRDKFPDNFNQIQENLKLCIPEFTQIRFDTIEPDEDSKVKYGDKTFKRFGLYNPEQKITYWADELSEGTLYFLALLCIINQPDPPKLLLLEEPEKGIHPRRIWEVMKFIFQLAEDKGIQIIMTTHNEHVVNAFSSMPASVFVFDKDDETGATTVRNLQKDIIEPSHRKADELGLDRIDFTSNLGENWLYGLIGGVPSDES